MNHPQQSVKLTIPLARRLLQSHQISAIDLSSYCHALAHYGEESLSLAAFSHLFDSSHILAQAQESQERFQEAAKVSTMEGHGGTNGILRPLEGIPMTVKANIATRYSNLTASSQMLKESTPGYDSHVVEQLKNAGAILIGVTEMDEFGMGSLGRNATHEKGAARNPLYLGGDNGNGWSMPRQQKVDDWIQSIKSQTVPQRTTNSDFHYSAGGSSSGSAVSIAHGSSLASLATDTGGSIRLPAAWTGIVGFKPSYGQLSRRGVVSYASSLDTVGIMGNSVACVADVMNVLRNHGSEDDGEAIGVHVGDSTASFGGQSISLSQSTQKQEGLEGIKIGIPAAFCVEECSPHVAQAWEASIRHLERYGADIQVVSKDCVRPQTVSDSLPAYYVLTCAEASSNLARYDGLRYGMSYDASLKDMVLTFSTSSTILSDLNPRERQYATVRARGFGPEVKRRILCGTAVLSSDRFHTHYEAASYIRALMTQELTNAFRENKELGSDDKDEGVDLMLIPTALTHPPNLAGEGGIDPTEAFQNDVMTIPISLAGLPSISIPTWLSENENCCPPLVVGMQLFGPRLSEERVLTVANALQYIQPI